MGESRSARNEQAGPSAVSFVQHFDPMRFFEGRTVGHAVVRSGTRLLRRCRIDTEGASAPEFGSMHFDETYTYDDASPADVMYWAVKSAGPDRIEASELSVLGPVRSILRGAE